MFCRKMKEILFHKSIIKYLFINLNQKGVEHLMRWR